MSLFSCHAVTVQKLLESSDAALRLLPESEEKVALRSALAAFDDKIVPSVIELDKIVDYLDQRGIVVEMAEARKLLIDVTTNIDLGYIDSAIEEQINEYVFNFRHPKE